MFILIAFPKRPTIPEHFFSETSSRALEKANEICLRSQFVLAPSKQMATLGNWRWGSTGLYAWSVTDILRQL